MLFLPLIVALMRSAPPGASEPDAAEVRAAEAWLREWLTPLEANARSVIVGLDHESPETVDAAIDARVDSEEFRALLRLATRLVGENIDEVGRHWPSYQDELARAMKLLDARFPQVSADVDAALAAVRDSEWAVVHAEREHRLLSAGIEQIQRTPVEPGDRRDVRDPAVDDALRNGHRMAIAGACLIDFAENGTTLDPALLIAFCRSFRGGAEAYASFIVSSVSLAHPGFAARFGLAHRVHPEMIGLLRGSATTSLDPVLGSFSDAVETVDEITASVMRTRTHDELRARDA